MMTWMGALLTLLYLLAAGGLQAASIRPTAITVSAPDGSDPGKGPYTDDVFLDTLVFGDTVFRGDAAFSALSRVQVIEGRSRINADWGDDDTASDGHGNPFSRAGYDPELRETTDAQIQDSTIREALASRSLSEMTDGEGQGDMRLRGAFARGVTDNDAGHDDAPELILFERGMNDAFSLRLITGGSFDAPVFTASRTIHSPDFWNTGIAVNTTEIGGAQKLGVGAFDLSDFGIVPGQTVYGFEIFAPRGEGPDLNGLFLSSDNPNHYVAPPTQIVPAVPVPMSLPLLATALGFLGWRAKLQPWRRVRAGLRPARPGAALTGVPRRCSRAWWPPHRAGAAGRSSGRGR